ncbi:MAG: TolC family protein [Bacteroides intestinalis]|nr:TolC family protein [Bacteroides intestinalis]
MKKIILSIIVLFSVLSVSGQDVYTSVLEQIEQNSTTLEALKEQMEAQKLGNKTGINPANPEVEFGYLWGSPSAIGNRKDINIRQTFDFPTVYAQRSRLSDLQNNSAEYQYKSQRMELLLSAKTFCIELVYYNALGKLYERQLDNAKQIAEAYERMKQTGDANQLEYNKAVLNYTNMDNEVKRINLECKRLLSELSRLNGGGNPIVFDRAVYETAVLPADFENWYAQAEAENPALSYLKSQVEIDNRQVKLSRASSLPKFSVGYMGEFVAGQKFQGATIGMSIPLWENKNKVKQAKATVKASERIVEDARMQYYNRLKNLYVQVSGLQNNVRQYNSVFEQNDNGDLLFKAYRNGEISLLNYLLEMEYYFVAYNKRLQTERDLELALAELLAAML